MQSALNYDKRPLRVIRRWLMVFIVILLLSGLSVFPIVTASDWLTSFFPPGDAMGNWFDRLNQGIRVVDDKYSFIFYGYDWMAFAHFLFAILYVGAWRDPVKNQWLIEFGMIACILIIPTALIGGHFRGIPLWWQLIDCSFGVLGLILLSICNGQVYQLISAQREEEAVDIAPIHQSKLTGSSVFDSNF